ncbi:MAG TPA: hypothetical protein VKA27_04610, partial [Sunxiuqinia sp.]|nr:hypothetical protein [Sunxiuqinia sp.]
VGHFLTLNPYVKLFNINTFPNTIARQHQIFNRHEMTYEAALSAIASFHHSWTAAFRVQYQHPENDLQGTQYGDALYFVSLKKNINKKLKVGIISGLPFKHSFVYHGEKIRTNRFDQHSEGNIIIHSIPCWFSIQYQFDTGKKVHTIQRGKETIDQTPKKGF